MKRRERRAGVHYARAPIPFCFAPAFRRCWRQGPPFRLRLFGFNVWCVCAVGVLVSEPNIAASDTGWLNACCWHADMKHKSVRKWQITARTRRPPALKQTHRLV